MAARPSNLPRTANILRLITPTISSNTTDSKCDAVQCPPLRLNFPRFLYGEFANENRSLWFIAVAHITLGLGSVWRNPERTCGRTICHAHLVGWTVIRHQRCRRGVDSVHEPIL